ncbi:gamma-tubulin complex component 5 isoform X2 [Ischnura elegans]|uniref:gamma-tubulin complex component 5 isoform X2 n=1 Tax=Ischnura elegans TaxID=197161 RepID=UPI001ED89635|nr:gamma-tubulin complex component 5 isoform X2 [Ischnura elegans]
MASPGDDKFSQLEHYVYSNIWSDKFNAVDRYSIKKSIDGVIRKFFIHGLSLEAERLQSLLDQFLNNKEWENPDQPDVRWHLLSLLLHLSYHPTGSTLKELPEVKPVVEEPNNEFDWPAYLLENQPDFISLGSDGSETEDECLSFDDEVPGDCYSLAGDIASEANARGGVDPVVEAVSAVSEEHVWSHIEGTLASARLWLEGNVVLPHAQGCRVPSKYPSANLAKFCGDAVENAGEHSPASMVAMSEHRVLREALRALVAPSPPKMTSRSSGLFFLDQRGLYQPKGTVVIPSLTKGSLQSHLRWLGNYMSMVWELEKFIAEILDSPIKEQCSVEANTVDTGQAGDKGSCLPSYTYEAYASALKEFLSSFKDKVQAVEEKVKCQESVCTLLTVAQDLRPVFRELELVYRTHLDATSCWKVSSNWLNSCRLLTVLYGALLSSFSDVSASLYFHLFMKAFHPYLEIIHTWLTEGQLEDWREEFIICRNELMCNENENLWKEGFILRPYEEELSKVSNTGGSLRPLDHLHLIRDKVLPLGKNMELLHRLDRLSEVRRSQPSFERSLYHELIYALKTEINEEFKGVTMEEETTSASVAVEDLEQSSLLKSLALGIEDSKNYYLKRAFGDISYLEGGMDSGQFMRKQLTSQLGRDHGKDMEDVGKGLMAGVVPLRVGCLLSRLLEERHGASSVIVRTLLLGEFSLTSHLLVVRKVFLMEEGDCMHHFCTQLFQQVEQGEKWVDSLSLTNHLLECISTRWPDYASNFSVLTSLDGTVNQLVKMESVSSSGGGSSQSLLDQVDHIHITYAVNWPVNIVLNAGSLENYSTVFQFLLKVKWALWSLQQLRFCDLKPGRVSMDDEDDASDSSMPTSVKLHRLQLLRAWLLHFVGSVHAYLMGQVLHVLSVKMDGFLEEACDLDSIIQVHEKYVEVMYQQCLQTKNSEIIKMAIIRVLDISMVLCKLWKQPDIITPMQLYDMESQYIRHHVFLARVLESVTNRGFSDYCKRRTRRDKPSDLGPSPPPVLRSPIPEEPSQLLCRLPESLRFSCTLLPWQRSTVIRSRPLGAISPVPAVISCYLDSQLWNACRRQIGEAAGAVIYRLLLNDLYALFVEGLLDQPDVSSRTLMNILPSSTY